MTENRLKNSTGDVAHSLAKAGLSFIPWVGGTAAELFSLIVSPPLTKRRDLWIEEIAVGLERLQEKVESFSIASLSQNDTFITTVLHATQTAIRNHQTEKLDALRNAVLNAALSNSLEDDIQLILLGFIDDLTPWHLRILMFFNNPVKWARENNLQFPDFYMGSPATVLEHAFPDLKGKRDLYDHIVKDLFNRGLMNTESLHTTMTANGMTQSRTTSLGGQFINFISSPVI